MAGTDTPKPAAQPEAESEPDVTTAAVSPAERASIGRRVLQQLVENPLQSLFGAAIIALLTFTLTTTQARFGDINHRIDDQNAAFNARLDDVNDRIDATNDRITRLEEKMEARFEALEASVAEINLKLTALIAALNMSAQVDAAQEGRLITPEQASDPE